VIYGAGALTLLWFSSTIVGAVSNIPLVRPQHTYPASQAQLPLVLLFLQGAPLGGPLSSGHAP
jgi:hypothetical protein